MKQLSIYLILMLSVYFTYAQEIFMYDENGKKVFFQESDSLLQIMFKDNLDETEKRDITLGINRKYTENLTKSNSLIIVPDKNAKFDIDKLVKDNGIVYVNQSLINTEGKIVIPTDKVMAQIKDGYELENVLKKLNINFETYRRLVQYY